MNLGSLIITPRNTSLGPGKGLSLALLLTVFLFPSPGFAEKLRVVAWDMRLTGPGELLEDRTDSAKLQFALAALKQMKPDVVILHYVRDWDMCSQIAEGLSPDNYRVLLCSQFPETPQGRIGEQQIAILSLKKAYFTWSEEWKEAKDNSRPGGFAFAAVEVGHQKLGLFAVQANETRLASPQKDSAAENSRDDAYLRQWQTAVDSFKGWVTNRVEAAVISGTITTAHLHPATAFLGAPLSQPLNLADPTKNSFSASLPVSPDALAGVVMSYAPLLCDVNLDRRNPALATLTESGRFREYLLPASQPGSFEERFIPLKAQWRNRWVKFCMSAGGVLLIGLLIRFFWRRLQPQPLVAETEVLHLPPNTSSTTSMVTVTLGSNPSAVAETRTGAHLDVDDREHLRREAAGWLKEKFVRTLVTDRAELLETQRQANAKVTAVDERLRRIEERLIAQSQIYESRIQDLTTQLAESKEENRALIQAKILQIKAEMETARAVLIQENTENSSGLP